MRNKITVMLVIVFIVLQGCSNNENSESIGNEISGQTLNENIFTFNEIYKNIRIYEDKKQDIIPKVGSPNEIINFGIDQYALKQGGITRYVEKYIYNNFFIIFSGEHIMVLSISDADYATSSGVAIGSTIDIVHEKYGTGNYLSQDKDMDDYHDYDKSIMLSFGYSNEKVKEIKFLQVYQ